MGHDYIWCKGKYNEGRERASGYVSSNWNVMSKYWHISNAHGHTGRTIAKQLEKAIEEAKKAIGAPLNAAMEMPDGMDGWGHKKNGEPTEDERTRVFICIMERIHGEAIEHPTLRLWSDQVGAIDQEYAGDSDDPSDDSDDSDEEPDEPTAKELAYKEKCERFHVQIYSCGWDRVKDIPIIPVRDGKTNRVTSAADALHHAAECTANGDGRADDWMWIAGWFPDAPAFCRSMLDVERVMVQQGGHADDE
jgi:hypothetical protein